MQTSVEFRSPFSYSNGISLFLFIILIILIIFIIKKKKKTKPVVIVAPPKKDLNKIKEEYLKQLSKLQEDTIKYRINYRTAYITLSRIIREFIYEATNINVKTLSLAEVKSLNIPYLYDLMKEYYAPEFAYLFPGNIEKSIDKTRGVIEKWK